MIPAGVRYLHQYNGGQPDQHQGLNQKVADDILAQTSLETLLYPIVYKVDIVVPCPHRCTSLVRNSQGPTKQLGADVRSLDGASRFHCRPDTRPPRHRRDPPSYAALRQGDSFDGHVTAYQLWIYADIWLEALLQGAVTWTKIGLLATT